MEAGKVLGGFLHLLADLWHPGTGSFGLKFSFSSKSVPSADARALQADEVSLSKACVIAPTTLIFLSHLDTFLCITVIEPLLLPVSRSFEMSVLYHCQLLCCTVLHAVSCITCQLGPQQDRSLSQP